MDGTDYRALVELSDRAGAVLARVGETCARVPAGSLPWLLEQGVIEVTPASTVAPRDVPADADAEEG